MNIRIGIVSSLAVVHISGLVFAAEQPQPKWFVDATQSTGIVYRVAVSNALAIQDTAKTLSVFCTTSTPNNADCQQAHILLARIQHPEVFASLDAFIQTERVRLPNGERQGFLSGMLLLFVKSGPESKTVDERVGWRKTDYGNRPAYNKVERFTDTEVQTGIARNAAARQAVLERFLKFLGEGNAYEQSELLDFVYRQWGSTSSERRKDEPVADDLIESVYKDTSRPLALRIRAASYFPDVDRKEKQTFLLNAATNTISTEIAPRDVKPHDVNVKTK